MQAFIPNSQSNILDVVRDGSDTNINTVFAIPFENMDATLTEHSVNFTATSTETVDIWFQKNKSAIAGGEIYLDDVVFEEDGTASIQYLQQFNFNYGPNPTKDIINLSAADNIEAIEIYNVLGQQMLSKKLNLRNSSIDISNLTKGIYVMKVAIGDSKGTFKFIKE